MKEFSVVCQIHEWVVFSTALGEGWLMLQCVECGLHARVEDPSAEEWADGFHSPSRPYRWSDERRVVVHDEIPADYRYVQRKPSKTKKCNCLSESGEYERVWIEATKLRPQVTAEARKELLELAEMADGADEMCSTNFSRFIDGYQQATGIEPSYAVRWIAKRLDGFPAHCSSSVVARLLREVAKPQSLCGLPWPIGSRAPNTPTEKKVRRLYKPAVGGVVSSQPGGFVALNALIPYGRTDENVDGRRSLLPSRIGQSDPLSPSYQTMNATPHNTWNVLTFATKATTPISDRRLIEAVKAMPMPSPYVTGREAAQYLRITIMSPGACNATTDGRFKCHSHTGVHNRIRAAGSIRRSSGEQRRS